jgi:peptidyl-prolyl cis-trans isomerase A (cyclophilin A)
MKFALPLIAVAIAAAQTPASSTAKPAAASQAKPAATSTAKPAAASQAKPAATSTPKAPAATPAATASPKPSTAKPKPAAAPKPVRENGLYATLNITHDGKPLGNIVFRFYEKQSPVTSKNFVDLALGRKDWQHPESGETRRTRFYDGLTFHRVIPGFMIQGGDPIGNGTGGVKEIPDEFDPELKFDVPGLVAMANAGPGTGSCQFFITEVPTPHLTGRHTIFGTVVEGQELVNAIARVPRDPRDKPLAPVKIARVTIDRYGPNPNAPKPAAKPAAKKTTAAKPVSTPPAASTPKK